MNNKSKYNISQPPNLRLFDSKIILTINGGGNTLNNLIDTLHSLSYGALILFEEMLKYGHTLQYIRFAQETIGNNLGYTRPHTNVLLQEIKDAGLIDFFGPHREVCNYFINEMFLLPQIRFLLQHWFPVLTMVIKINLTLLRINDIYTKKTPDFFKIYNIPEQPFCWWTVNKAEPPDS